MKNIIIIFSMIFANNLLAEIDTCGKYKVEGKILRTENQYYLVLNQGSASEKKLEVSRDDLPKIVPYFDKSFTAILKVTKFKNQKVEAFNILEIDRSIEHEMSPNIRDTVTRVESLKCEN